MFGLNEQTRVFLRTGVTDGRLGIDGLRGLVGKAMRQDVLAGALYVFCNGRRNRIRCLLWDGSGFWLATKRVERATFAWPRDEAQVRQMSLAQLRLLLDGFELTSRRGWQRYEDCLPDNRARPETIATRDLQRAESFHPQEKQHAGSAKLYTSRSHAHRHGDSPGP